MGAGLIYTIETGTTSETYIHFLKKLEKHIRKQDETKSVVLVFDGHKAHEGNAFRDWVSQFHDRVIEHKLPPSSSVLNPIEHVWSLVKHTFAKLSMDKQEHPNLTDRQIVDYLRNQMHESVLQSCTPEIMHNMAVGCANERYHCVINGIQ